MYIYKYIYIYIYINTCKDSPLCLPEAFCVCGRLPSPDKLSGFSLNLINSVGSLSLNPKT